VPRLFVEGRRYELLSSTALQELEYQALLRQHSRQLFPDLIVVPFTKPVYFEGIGHAADFAAIDPKYRKWWVLEVELAHHSLEGHVRPQVTTLANASYGKDEAEWLADKSQILDKTRLEQMMQGSQPEVAVVVNSPKPDWAIELRGLAIIMIVELFRSDTGRFVFRQNGVELDVPRDAVTLVQVMMARLLMVESPAPLLALQRDRLEIEYEGELTEWNVVESADKVFLHPRRSSIFPSHRWLKIVRLPEGRLGLVPAEHRRGMSSHV
jgi:hypothetical protein